MKIKKCLIIFIAFFISMSYAFAEMEMTYALKGCRIVPVTGTPIEKGVIILRNGLIDAVGKESEVEIPKGTKIINAEGLTAYPGFIDAMTNLFVPPPKFQPIGMMEAYRGIPKSKQDTGFHPDVEAAHLIKPQAQIREKYHKWGITTVLAAPITGYFSGKSVLLNLNGDNPGDMVVVNPVALHASFSGARGTYPGTGMGVIAAIKQASLDAAYYEKKKDYLDGGGSGVRRETYNAQLEALIPYLVGKEKIIFDCKNHEEIKQALKLIRELKLNAFIAGAAEAWRAVDHLKKEPVPLLLSLNFKPPYTSVYFRQGKELQEKAEKEIYPRNALELYENKLLFAFTSYGLTQKDDFLVQLRKAVDAGLPKEEAVKALTINPAAILGVSHIIGSLEKGKIANVILVEGDLFQKDSRIKEVYVDGIRFEPKEKKPPQDAGAVKAGGHWKGKIAGLEGFDEVQLELKEEKGIVTGKLASGDSRWEIKDGLLEKNSLKFTVEIELGGKKTEMKFTGKITEDTLKGEFIYVDGKAEMTASRIPEKKTDGGLI